MNIALFGATGSIGKAIALEALSRGHQVTGLVRHPEKSDLSRPGFILRQANVLDATLVAAEVTGHEAVVSAIAPDFDTPIQLITAAHSLIQGLGATQVRRLLIVGGAGSLEVAPGLQLVDSPQFPPSWRPVAMAHRDALEVYRQDASLDWTYFSPAAMISPGQRTGSYRIGGDQLLSDAQGKSTISNEDFAAAMLDEIEQPRFIRQRITVAY